MRASKLTQMALLTSVALIIFVIEAQIPNPIPIQGVKLGLSNIVTVYAMFALGPGPALMILLARITLGSLFTGQIMALLYSFCGGLLSAAAMLVMRRLVTQDQIFVCSAIAAIFHNIGQIAAAVWVTKTPALVAHLPLLTATGLLAGIFTGLCAQYVLKRLSG